MRSIKTLLTAWITLILFSLPTGQQTPGGIISPQAQPPQMPPDPKLEKALIEYEKLVKEHPDIKELNYNLGNIIYLMGDMESAISEYEKAEEIREDIPRSHSYYNLGNAKVKQGNLQEAVSLYKKAMMINPDDEDIKYNYELSRQMLQQQQQQQQNKDSDKNQDQQDQQQQDQQTSDSQQKQEPSEEKQDQKGDEQDKEEVDDQKKPSEDSAKDEEKKEDESQPQPTPSEDSEEKKLGKEEAEAILNALKANENNMMKKKYVSAKRVKTDKDW